MIRRALASSLLLALAACGRGAPAPSAEPAATLRVRLAVAESLAAPRTTEISGTVEAERRAAVASRIMATVVAVPVALGDRVARGALLVELDPTAAQGQAAQAAGALAQARAALTLAQRNFERFSELAARDSASQLELDGARAQYEQAKGAVEQAEGALAAARSLAGDSRVVAPFAGRVAARAVEVGDLAAPGRPLVEIESETGRRLVVALPESLASSARLAPGTPVPVLLDSRPELGELGGRIAESSPGPDPATHSYTVKIALGDGEVAVGAAGRARFATGERLRVAVPRSALIEQGGLTLVVLRGADGLAQSRVVTVGAALAGDRLEILTGLAGGEAVALGLGAAPATGTRLEEGGS
ncbi:MAG: efflux RND transporter periplasmic adaptor subunit [Thermoanaerobaculia bacterium]